MTTTTIITITSITSSYRISITIIVILHLLSTQNTLECNYKCSFTLKTTRFHTSSFALTSAQAYLRGPPHVQVYRRPRIYRSVICA